MGQIQSQVDAEHGVRLNYTHVTEGEVYSYDSVWRVDYYEIGLYLNETHVKTHSSNQNTY